jgi:hypothetical protein
LIFQIIDYLGVLVDKIGGMDAVVVEVPWFNFALASKACLDVNELMKKYKHLIDLRMVYSKLKNEKQKSDALSRLLLKSQELFCTKHYKEKNHRASTCEIF